MLTDDGVIFISIDDNEQANLKKICDEIFGEGNFVAILKWKKKKQPSFLSVVAEIIEYIIVYSKNRKNLNNLAVNKLADNDKPIINSTNKFNIIEFKKGIRVKADVEKISAGIYQNKTMVTEYLDDVYVKNGRTENLVRVKSKFRTTQSEIDKFQEEDLIFITSNLGLRRDLMEEEKEKRKSITDLILDWGQNQDATDETKKIFEIKSDINIFDNPKPSLLIKNMILSVVYSQLDSTILDFFSGSATTAHSVMKLNSEDNGNRKFIMVQLPEETDKKSEAFKAGYKNICEIGKERIRRAGEKIKEEIEKENINLKFGEEPKKVPDIGFKVFRVDDTNIRWKEMEEINETDILNSPDMLDFKVGTKDTDVVYELMLRQPGVPLSETLEKLTEIGNRTYLYADSYLVCLETEITEEMIKKIAEINPLPFRFIFRYWVKR